MELSTVIVHYRSREALRQCLASLESETVGLAHEAVVVDNDRDDHALGMLAREFPEVRGILNPENVGYARAVNQGLSATTGEFVLVMNPDCVPQPGSVATLVGYLRAQPRAGVAGPMILDGDGSLQYSARAFPDHLTFLFNRYSLLTRLFPGNRFSRRYLLSDWDHASAREVDWLSGACLLVRRAAIDQVGPMDEAYFMFNEDVDWCRRMKLAGWAVVYVPDARVVHHIGASRKRVSTRVIVQRHLGMIHYFHKFHPTHPVMALVTDALILMRAVLMLMANAMRPVSRRPSA
jgi:N-acetylglucosaminyl-diphospho-decaprenol L-rhamnosyltransferase